mmetsp:Transcript_23761/g.58974  ORF Transcript_23761/g.58974 Transcript_23761/m.58974 type:complete len:234 (-) Transcript_23761:301-1002(-)
MRCVKNLRMLSRILNEYRVNNLPLNSDLRQESNFIGINQIHECSSGWKNESWYGVCLCARIQYVEETRCVTLDISWRSASARRRSKSDVLGCCFELVAPPLQEEHNLAVPSLLVRVRADGGEHFAERLAIRREEHLLHRRPPNSTQHQLPSWVRHGHCARGARPQQVSLPHATWPCGALVEQLLDHDGGPKVLLDLLDQHPERHLEAQAQQRRAVEPRGERTFEWPCRHIHVH